MKTLEALKSLAVALGCATSAVNVTGETVDEVITFIAANLPDTYKGNSATLRNE
jgi:hypothetical protein